MARVGCRTGSREARPTRDVLGAAPEAARLLPHRYDRARSQALGA
ncbi:MULTISPECIES: hypothetical protein [unclassified Streptomyces]|nr:hypothetical protein [Streptomyces sp. KAU_LT]MDI9830454.1 hypothetical protein [Streptomyces sp. KAU_LT]